MIYQWLISPERILLALLMKIALMRVASYFSELRRVHFCIQVSVSLKGSPITWSLNFLTHILVCYTFLYLLFSLNFFFESKHSVDYRHFNPIAASPKIQIKGTIENSMHKTLQNPNGMSMLDNFFLLKRLLVKNSAWISANLLAF